MTIYDALLYGKETVGTRDAKLFLSHITGYSVNGLVLKPMDKLTETDVNEFRSFVARRQTGEPLQYIIGAWEFMGLPMLCDKRALIPRPETELLVEDVLEFLKQSGGEKVRVLDVCTGTGCIALAVAALTDAQVEVVAVDICENALALAKENAANLGLSHCVEFVQSDLLAALYSGDDFGHTEHSANSVELPKFPAEKKFHIIISNPPYIPTAEMHTLSPTVRDHEPHRALHGGTDGLDFYRRLIPQCKNALHDNGALFLEIGPMGVLGIMKGAGFAEINLRRDYAELPRIVRGMATSENPC